MDACRPLMVFRLRVIRIGTIRLGEALRHQPRFDGAAAGVVGHAISLRYALMAASSSPSSE